MEDDSLKMTDERLSAWVDGEGDAAERAAVQAWLAAHPADAERVRDWIADRDALRQTLHPGGAGDRLAERLRELVWQGPRRPPPWAVAAAAAGLLVLGGLIGAAIAWRWQPGAPIELAVRGTGAAAEPAWVQRAAFAHSVYVPEPRHAVEVKAQEEHLARWLTRRIDAQVKLFDLREHGFELVGGRLLPDGHGKSAQLMYQDAQGVRVTVYLRKPEPGTQAAFRYERHGELSMFYWVEEDCGYALVGPLPREQMLALAQTIHDQEGPHAGHGAPGAAASSPTSSKSATTPSKSATTPSAPATMPSSPATMPVAVPLPPAASR